MASPALTPLLSLLKEMKMEIGGPAVSDREPGLFKELLEQLQLNEPDTEAIEALMERVEGDSFPSGESKLPAVKEVSSLEPIRIKTGERLPPLPDIAKSRDRSEKEPLATPRHERGERWKSKEPSSRPARHLFDPGETILHARHTSYSALERKMEDLQALHTIRSSRSLKEIIRHAEDFGLDITDVKIERQKEKGAAVPPETGKSPLPTTAILQRTEHLSQSAAALIQQPETRKSGHPTPRFEAVSTLRTLLAEPKRETDETKDAEGEAQGVKRAAPRERQSEFARLLSGLEVSVKVENRSASETTPSISATETVDPSAPASRGDDPEAVLADPIHTETKMKATEQLTQKIVEARSTLRHFAQSLQEQVENYKPPFTRMQLSLEPKELGSVEVTLVSRGNNLHIQVHSNPTAIGIMATHGQELRSQLVSMGFTDVQMQFNMNQQQQQQQRRGESYSGQYTEGEEFSELYESLDLIVPHYV